MSHQPEVFARVGVSVLLTAFIGLMCALFAIVPAALSVQLWAGLALSVAFGAVAIVSVWRWSPGVNSTQRIWASVFFAYLLIALIDAFASPQTGDSAGVFEDRVRAAVFVGLVGIPLLVFVIRGRIDDLLLAAMIKAIQPLVQGNKRPGG
ncbi:MAG: hypothetical protein KF724_13755 [Phycisphaeraceae bacterium]|nr:hypothetical protein [Phycisphaeraceae bacterium]